MEAVYKSKKSAWGAISILLVVFFGVVAPVGLAVLPLMFKETLGEIALIVGIICAVVSFIVTVVWTIVAIYRAKQVSYEFCGNTLIVKEGAVFSGATENRRMHFFPGMSVSVKQSLKGKIFNYGDVVVSMGVGQAGQIILQGIKNPKKAGTVLSHYAAEISNTRTNSRVSIFMPGVTGYPFFF